MMSPMSLVRARIGTGVSASLSFIHLVSFYSHTRKRHWRQTLEEQRRHTRALGRSSASLPPTNHRRFAQVKLCGDQRAMTRNETGVCNE